MAATTRTAGYSLKPADTNAQQNMLDLSTSTTATGNASFGSRIKSWWINSTGAVPGANTIILWIKDQGAVYRAIAEFTLANTNNIQQLPETAFNAVNLPPSCSLAVSSSGTLSALAVVDVGVALQDLTA